MKINELPTPCYVIDEKKSLNTDYHIKHEATEIAHLESLFDTLNEFN